MVSVDLLRFFITLMVFFTNSILVIYLLTFVMGVVASFFGPTSNVFIVNNVEQNYRKKFNAIISTVNSGAMLIGPALAGIIISLTSINICILITSILFIICASCIYIIPNSEKINSDQHITDEKKYNVIFRDLKSVYSFFKKETRIFKVFFLFYSAIIIGYALDSQEATYITYD